MSPRVQPIGWQYTVKPPLTHYDYPGNLIFQIRRAKEDKREFTVYSKPQADMIRQEIRTFPDASGLSPRRLLNCANLIRTLGSDADGMRRYVCACDSREKEKNYGSLPNPTESQTQVVDSLLSRLSESQLSAFRHIEQTKRDVVFIQGPPGTGINTFVVMLLQIL